MLRAIEVQWDGSMAVDIAYAQFRSHFRANQDLPGAFKERGIARQRRDHAPG